MAHPPSLPAIPNPLGEEYPGQRASIVTKTQSIDPTGMKYGNSPLPSAYHPYII